MLVGWLAGWLVGWLAGWLASWLAQKPTFNTINNLRIDLRMIPINYNL
jgi:uncharacterized membrane protein YeaQ/YmgE (transglycosylase-associated protein family)